MYVQVSSVWVWVAGKIVLIHVFSNLGALIHLVVCATLVMGEFSCEKKKKVFSVCKQTYVYSMIRMVYNYHTLVLPH